MKFCEKIILSLLGCGKGGGLRNFELTRVSKQLRREGKV